MDNLEKLKSEGIYKDGDALLYGNSLPALWEIAVYGGALATLVGMTNFAIVRNEQGIVILPCNKVTNAIILEKKIFIPSNEVKFFNVENGNMGFYKISIMGQDKCLFSFQISKNVTQPIRENLDLLFNKLECKNIEIIKKPNKVFVGICVFVLIAVMIIAFVAAIIEGEYFIMLCGSFFFAWLIYALVKAKKKK